MSGDSVEDTNSAQKLKSIKKSIQDSVCTCNNCFFQRFMAKNEFSGDG